MERSLVLQGGKADSASEGGEESEADGRPPDCPPPHRHVVVDLQFPSHSALLRSPPPPRPPPFSLCGDGEAGCQSVVRGKRRRSGCRHGCFV